MPINTNRGTVSLYSDVSDIENSINQSNTMFNNIVLVAKKNFSATFTAPSNTFCYSSLSLSDNVSNTKISGTNPHFLSSRHNNMYIGIANGTNWPNNLYRIVSVDDTSSFTVEFPYSASLGSPTIATVSNAFTISSSTLSMGADDTLQYINESVTFSGTSNTSTIGLVFSGKIYNIYNPNLSSGDYYNFFTTITNKSARLNMEFFNNSNTSNQMFLSPTSASGYGYGLGSSDLLYSNVPTSNTTVSIAVSVNGAGEWIRPFNNIIKITKNIP